MGGGEEGVGNEGGGGERLPRLGREKSQAPHTSLTTSVVSTQGQTESACPGANTTLSRRSDKTGLTVFCTQRRNSTQVLSLPVAGAKWMRPSCSAEGSKSPISHFPQKVTGVGRTKM